MWLSWLFFPAQIKRPGNLPGFFLNEKNGIGSKEEGRWETPINLSVKMNFLENSKFPYVSPDQKFMFFSSGENIYWVDSKILVLE